MNVPSIPVAMALVLGSLAVDEGIWCTSVRAILVTSTPQAARQELTASEACCMWTVDHCMYLQSRTSRYNNPPSRSRT